MNNTLKQSEQDAVDRWLEATPRFPMDERSISKFTSLFDAAGLPITAGNLQQVWGEAVRSGELAQGPDYNNMPLEELRSVIEGPPAPPSDDAWQMSLDELRDTIERDDEKLRAEQEKLNEWELQKRGDAWLREKGFIQ